MAKNTFLDWDTTANNNTDIGGIAILGTSPVNNFDDALRTAMAQLRAGVDGEVVYAAKSGNYTAVLNDNNAWHRYTATATITLTAAATLGANWHYYVQAVGASTVVTIDPNGSETIGGVTTLVIRGGQTAFIICDGTNFQVDIRGTAYATQSGAYTALLGDKGTVQRITAAATLSLTAAATLGSGWTMEVVADGGAITIDPNGSETINGAATAFVPDGGTAKIICNGSAFFLAAKPNAWEVIKSESFSAISTFTATDLGAFVMLRFVFRGIPASDATFFLQLSTDNGATWLNGAGTYFHQTLSGAITTTSALNSSSTAFQVSNAVNVLAATNGLMITGELEGFNKSRTTNLNSRTNFTRASDSARVVHLLDGLVAGGAKNALKIFTSGSINFQGSIVLEGVRG